MKKGSIKYNRMNEEVLRVVSQIITKELKDPRICPMTSVVSVDVTADLKYAKVYVSVLGDEKEKEKTKEGLLCAAPFVRTKLAEELNLRNTPEITFVMDDSIENGISMIKKIEELNGKE